MLSYQTVEPATLRLLRQLMNEEMLADTRLVGGTALALQYGHRMSVDLDFFGRIDEEADLKPLLRQAGKVTVLKESPNIRIYLIDDIKVDFVNYRYDWLNPPVVEENIRLASVKDIAAMKVNAIEGRGSKKDFIDMYFLLRHHSLEEIIHAYQAKYPEHSIFRAMMSLSYFEDADKQLMPKMFIPVGWEEMKTTIANEVKKHSV